MQLDRLILEARDIVEDDAMTYLRTKSPMAKIIDGMAKAMKPDRFGMKDARVVIDAWFEGKEPDPKYAKAWKYLLSPQGKKMLVAVTKGVANALGKGGMRDIRKAVAAFMA